ncbi:MAG: recombinase family protein [Nitrospirota bacterium]|nr:recombinase family protein [Nitrospirota bacterium]
MIAAIYARKSTEQHGMSDEEKSVTRQVEHAKAYAATKGWTVAEEHIYQDDGISGAEFVKRPGFLRLMNSLKPHPPFQVLIMSEESRLGRESIETSYALKQITDAGVRVFFYLTDQERRLDTALDKVMVSLSNFASEMERERAKQRTHDAMLRKAKAGHVVGGKVFGYDNVDVFGEPGPDGKPHRQCVIRRINLTEAAIVRRIFEGYASGLGLTRLAKMLNNEKVSPPRHGIHGWAPSAIREMLHREMYCGVVLWNRSQAVQRGGTKKQRKRPVSEWLRLEAPELRIIPEELWGKVQGQLTKARRCYLRGTGGRLLGRPSGVDARSQYLLSGIARCAVCGGSLSVFNRTRGRHERKVYGCVYYHKRGTAVCSNSALVGMDILDSALLHSIQRCSTSGFWRNPCAVP